jgi:chromosome partitioning protein
MGKIISIVNQKGGVAKTTTAINLSAAVGLRGYRTLLVDLDPQGNSTSGLGIDRREVKNCIYDLLINDAPFEVVVMPSEYRNLDLIPATIQLAGAEVELVSAISRESKLRRSLRPQSPYYDFIFIDCPPSLGLLTINALTASDSMLIPLQCEYYALEGVTQLLSTYELIQESLNPSLQIEGVLLTMYDARTNLSAQVAEEARGFFGKKVYDTVISRSVKLSEAPSHGTPGIFYDNKARGAEEYQALAEEFLAAQNLSS